MILQGQGDGEGERVRDELEDAEDLERVDVQVRELQAVSKNAQRLYQETWSNQKTK